MTNKNATASSRDILPVVCTEYPKYEKDTEFAHIVGYLQKATSL